LPTNQPKFTEEDDEAVLLASELNMPIKPTSKPTQYDESLFTIIDEIEQD